MKINVGKNSVMRFETPEGNGATYRESNYREIGGVESFEVLGFDRFGRCRDGGGGVTQAE